MQIFPDMLEDVTPDNIQQLCADQVSEGTELELKSDLPTRDGRLDTWHGGGPIGDYARNEIAEEIIAFANTLGGTLCVGIAETSDHPKRADSPRPLPRVHELARRLRQSVYAIIDPPLPVLEAVGVELQAGSGVVLLRVPPSRRRPHRHQVSKEVFVRRNDETVRITMREIQELTMQAVSEATRIEATISKRREEFRKGTQEWLSAPRDPSGKVFVAKGAGFHVLALPTIQIDLGRVVGRPRLTNLAPTVNVQLSNGQQEQCHWPWRPTDWKPQLRSIASTFKRRDSVASYSLKTNGTCELEFKLKATEEQPGLFIGWLVGALGFMLAWMERVRTEAGVPVEFACAIQIPIFKGPVSLVQYGVSTFAQSQGALLPKGFHEFPLVSVGAAEEFPAILRRFNEDLWDLAGYGVQQAAPAFSFTPAV